MEKLLSADQVAELLHISKLVVYRMASKHTIPGFKVGKAWRFRQSDLERVYQGDLMEKLLTTEQVAEFLQISKFTVYHMAVKQTIPAFKIGKVWRLRESDLEKWIEAQVARHSQKQSQKG